MGRGPYWTWVPAEPVGAMLVAERVRGGSCGRYGMIMEGAAKTDECNERTDGRRWRWRDGDGGRERRRVSMKDRGGGGG